MLNQERIKLMTKMASYEEKQGRKNMSIGSYFRSDYMGLQVIKSIICATLAFAILFGLYLYYNFEFFMQDIYKMDLLTFGRNILTYYFIFVVIYSLITYVIYSFRYNKAKRGQKRYYYHLKQLSAMYDLEKGGR